MPPGTKNLGNCVLVAMEMLQRTIVTISPYLNCREDQQRSLTDGVLDRIVFPPAPAGRDALPYRPCAALCHEQRGPLRGRRQASGLSAYSPQKGAALMPRQKEAPRPCREASIDFRSACAQKHRLAQRHAVVAQDVVGGGDVEIKIRHRDIQQVAQAAQRHVVPAKLELDRL